MFYHDKKIKHWRLENKEYLKKSHKIAIKKIGRGRY